MEGSGSGSYTSQGGRDMMMCSSGGGLEALQKQHEEKMERIQQLKKEIESVKIRFEQRKKEIPEEQLQAIKVLTDKYDMMREEYNALLAHKSLHSATLNK